MTDSPSTKPDLLTWRQPIQLARLKLHRLHMRIIGRKRRHDWHNRQAVKAIKDKARD